MKTKGFLLAAAVAAMAFTVSCTDDGGGEGSSGGGKGNDIRNYRTVEIGDQTWMAENLNYNVPGSKCYDNLDSNCVIYGRLYDWATAMALSSSCNSIPCSSQIQSPHRGICPSGWHIPSNDEWMVLEYYTVVTKLKATSGWNNNGNGTDDYEFSALPGGYGYPASGSEPSGFMDIGSGGYWWTASESLSSPSAKESELAHRRSIRLYLGSGTNSKSLLISVRCVKDN